MYSQSSSYMYYFRDGRPYVINMTNLNGHGYSTDDNAVGTPPVEDGTPLRSIGSSNWTSYHSCSSWARDFPKSAEISFTLPVSSNELYFISRGSYQYGKVGLVQATEDGDVADVKVRVRVAYHTDRALARSTICSLRKGNGNGIGIYTPSPGCPINFPADRLAFEVTFIFPKARPESPLHINKFTSHASNFAHEAGDLGKTMDFNEFVLRTANAPIDFKSITLFNGSLTSSNGVITGQFNAKNSLVLRTSNAGITASTALLSKSECPANLDISSSNGPINCKATLHTDSGSTGGSFHVRLSTSNASINLEYAQSPLGSRLISEARTSNARAFVQMHPTFEGSLDVSTSNASPRVKDSNPSDPSGAGRRRVQVINQNAWGRRITGTVSWGSDRRGTSSTTVHTSNSPADLVL